MFTKISRAFTRANPYQLSSQHSVCLPLRGFAASNKNDSSYGMGDSVEPLQRGNSGSTYAKKVFGSERAPSEASGNNNYKQKQSH